MLLRAGANVNARDKHGLSVLMLVARQLQLGMDKKTGFIRPVVFSRVTICLLGCRLELALVLIFILFIPLL